MKNENERMERASWCSGERKVKHEKERKNYFPSVIALRGRTI